MEKINLREIRKKLTNYELKKIIAGKQNDSVQDVSNINSTFSCLCSYNNTSVIQNTNSAGGCRCDCI